jgi:ribosomal protein S18 acetylase RimI-like enzyme
MPHKVELIEATREDLPVLIDIFKDPDLKTSNDESAWFVNCYFDYHHILVAKVQGEIQGACMWRIEGERDSGLGWIENIWVQEGFRRRGLAEMLLARAISDVTDFFQRYGIQARKMVLMTQNERTAARGLYEKMGFRHVASIDGMYDPGGHDMVYMLDL